MKRVDLNTITSLNEYCTRFGISKAPIKELEKIQTDVDYEVGLQQVFSFYRCLKTLTQKTSLGKVEQNGFYAKVLKNSGLIDVGKKTQLDEIIADKIISITVPTFDIGVVNLENNDSVSVKYEIAFGFKQNAFVKELHYITSFVVDCTNQIDQVEVKTNHKWTNKTKDGFFSQLEELDTQLLLIEKVIPYSYDYFTGVLPPFALDEDVDEQFDDLDNYGDDYDEYDDYM
ncbi:hypothetical protein EIN_268040 [Entamoeba invadens IP1]|uniref:Uncharacterized protein n=1 Tax=Entamoeba invadens IP1 TaxID=370355 RepID=A0A0A1U842_ENTIV|nr:hypothetical protein EIN_268040 [Entamoeba invadens IP1]ELP91068.1 hypothetical protein EIN_268040 [Entamoeba invadens IP1]|eukprot:XP_004257839.1 hypothetical protein EIN_268040 [Entamoeba invadens IP1]